MIKLSNHVNNLLNDGIQLTGPSDIKWTNLSRRLRENKFSDTDSSVERLSQMERIQNLLLDEKLVFKDWITTIKIECMTDIQRRDDSNF